MGTNYYAIPKADEETKLKIKDAIDRDQYFAAKELNFSKYTEFS